MPKYNKKVLKVVDLFSGLGGFSQAFVDRGHEVTRYEYDEKHKAIPCTIIKDVYTLTSNDLKDADIILASPPCTHFSYAAQKKGGHRHWPKGVPTEATREQIELVKHTLRIIKGANPKYWVLENPRGFLRRVIGTPSKITYWIAWGAKTMKPTHLWGKLPPVLWKQPLKKQRGDWGELMPRDSSLRALIPYDFSLALCLAAEGNSPQEILE